MKKPNNEANKGKLYCPSPFEKNKGRLKRLPPEERRSIARKGGLAKSERKRASSQLNPITSGNHTIVINIAKCNECPIKHYCELYKKDSACRIELNIRRDLIRQFKAFAGVNPKDMMKEIMKIYRKLEEATNKDPSFYKLLQQVYLLINIYKMKFGDKSFSISLQGDLNNTSFEIKKIMDELRGDVP